ncbi:MAG TPA: DUF885 family protein, partial [Nevskiaceae bacterium]|nr:DUF885 family protein [Nevskiaceae bacterium]
MALYQPSSLEQSLITVNRAAELAWAQQRGGLMFRLEAGESLDGGIPDLSLEGAQRRTRLGEEIAALLATVDDEKLPHEFALTSKLLRYYAAAWVQDAERYWLACDPTGSLFYGPFAQTAYTGGYLFSFIGRALAQFRFEKDGDGDRYLVLLSDITRLLRQIHARTAGQAERGILIHKLQLPAVRNLLAALRAGAAAGYPVALVRLSKLKEAGAVAAEIQRRVEQQVLPAFDALTAQLDHDYERQAPEGVGMDKLPGGKTVYDELVRLHTTMNLSPAQVHAAGHARMARIEAQMAEVRNKLGFKGSAAEFHLNLRKQPGAVAKTPDEIGARMRRHKDRVEQRFDEFFAQRSAFEY